MQTYADQYWTAEGREELRRKLTQIPDAALREVILDLINTDDPALFIAVLRGDLFGLAAREGDKRERLR
jgi:hypothetical protein